MNYNKAIARAAIEVAAIMTSGRDVTSAQLFDGKGRLPLHTTLRAAPAICLMQSFLRQSHSKFLSITSATFAGAFNQNLQSENDVPGCKRWKGAINLELLNPPQANENIDPKATEITNKPFPIITSKAPSNYFWLLFALASSARNSPGMRFLATATRMKQKRKKFPFAGYCFWCNFLQ